MTKSTKYGIFAVISLILYLISLNGCIKHMDDDEEDS